MRHRLGERLLASLLIFLMAFVATACSDPKGKEKVSDDPLVQVAYEMAYRALGDIRRAKMRKQSIHADCRAVELLAQKRLEKLDDPAVKRLLKELARLCEASTPY